MAGDGVARPVRLAVGVVLCGVLLAGCYTLQLVRGAEPQVGTTVAFDVNDAGRAALGGSMGPEIAQVEGRLLERDNGSYLLGVSSVRLLRGGEQPWAGEQVRLRTEYLGPAYRRQFSLGRSIGLGVVGVGGFTTFFLVSRSLLGAGTDDPGSEPCDTCAASRLGRP